MPPAEPVDRPVSAVSILLAGLLLGPAAPAGAEVTMEVGPRTGLKTWEWRHQGISLRLIQRLPDQTRAYLLARGFPAPVADEVARSCLFGSMFRNDGKKPLDFDLNDWRVLHDGQAGTMMTRERWDQRLSSRKVPKAGRIAFHWSLLPTRQHFEPGDYNWGMTSYGLPPGSRFDLELNLTVAGKPLQVLIPDMECAPEKLPEN